MALPVPRLVDSLFEKHRDAVKYAVHGNQNMAVTQVGKQALRDGLDSRCNGFSIQCQPPG